MHYYFRREMIYLDLKEHLFLNLETAILEEKSYFLRDTAIGTIGFIILPI